MQFDESRRGLGKTGHIHVYEAPIPTYDAGAPSETIYPWWRHEEEATDISTMPEPSLWGLAKAVIRNLFR